ncbi:ATP-grasp domain-containing protein [Kibdelosporangium phytohabitans]|uniref:Argininosuccinate lyase n=1 Tax=Kibdelosporangium phytohabitans TaxID=860235 RepID=A0A0N9I5U0_9PSEU|nr:ATP-grasp domain-containing protein [Kibdelosporangium phytohabitans]ALG11294.1 argininosuccinate lyase [Kibdelosporangium phytohabitans]MBE1462588.1 biotin carboxylase [Kibdelosporangium phytohabitans]
MTIVALEALTFGLGHMVRAAADSGERLCLLTGVRDIYRHELSRLPAGALDVFDVDTTDIDACEAILKQIPDLRGLINSTDTWLVPGAGLAARFGLPGRSVDSALFLRDKRKVRESLYEHGMSPAPGDTLPAVLKDSSGTSSRNVWLVRTPEELQAARDEAARGDLKGEVFAEPLFEGPVYSAETITWAGRTRLLGVLSRQVTGVREDAAAFPVVFPPGESVAGWVSEVLDVVEFEQGFAHVEFVLTVDGPQLVEINPRIGGALVGEALCRNLGTNVYESMIDMALGKAPTLLTGAEPTGPGVAFALVYPSQQGVLTAVDGVDRLAAYPGGPEWYPTKTAGDRVEHLTDQRGCVGIVLAEGPTAELAMHRALAAAAVVVPVVSPTAEQQALGAALPLV